MVQYRPAQLTTAATVWLAVLATVVLLVAPWIINAFVADRTADQQTLELGGYGDMVPVDTTVSCEGESVILSMRFDCEGTEVTSIYNEIGKDKRTSLERMLRMSMVEIDRGEVFHTYDNIARLEGFTGSGLPVVSMSVEGEDSALYVTIVGQRATELDRDIMKAVEEHAN